MEKDKALDVIEDLLDIDDRIKNLDACIQRKNKKARELAKRQLGLIQYLTRGGFIQDCGGNWCKDGDKVKVEIRDNFQGCWVEAILRYSNEKFGFYFEFIDKEVQKYLPDDVDVTDDYEFELTEPCEPNVCKDFEGV